MPDEQTALARAIESIVGGEHVTQEPTPQIDRLKPSLVARPGSAEEVAACMKVCSESGAAVVPAGRMTWLECGNPLRRVDVVLSLERMRRIIEYSPPDLTATVEAGLALAELNGVTERERQWLPLDPPGFTTASLGAIAACNSSGALRLGFGTPRDYVIGLNLTHADGTESKSGGRVVKNVAGYDLNKLYVGSYGTLAIINQLTFKLRPLPERISTILVTSKHLGALFQLAGRVLASELQPASVIFAKRVSSLPEDALLIRFIDNEAAVTNQKDWVIRAIDDNYAATVLSDDRAEAVWTEIANLDEHEIRVRLSVPLSSVTAVVEKVLSAQLDSVGSVDVGIGIIRMAFDLDEQSAIDQIRALRRETAKVGGTAVIEKGTAEVRGEADAWGDLGSTAALMRSIKTSFDRRSILSPGKFASGI